MDAQGVLTVAILTLLGSAVLAVSTWITIRANNAKLDAKLANDAREREAAKKDSDARIENLKRETAAAADANNIAQQKINLDNLRDSSARFIEVSTRAAASQAAYETLQKSVDAAAATNSARDTQLGEQKASIARSLDEIRDLKADKARDAGLIATLNLKIETMAATNTSKEAEVAGLRKIIEDSAKALADGQTKWDSERKELQAQVAELVMEREGWRKGFEELQARFDALQLHFDAMAPAADPPDAEEKQV